MQRNQKWEIVGRRSANAASKRQRNHAPAGTPVSYPMFAGYAVGSLLKDINPDANMHACAVKGATPTSVRSLGQRKDQLRSHMQNECFIKTALKSTQTTTACLKRSYATTPQLSRKREIGLIQLCKVQGMRARRYLPIEFVLPGQSRWLPSQLA